MYVNMQSTDGPCQNFARKQQICFFFKKVFFMVMLHCQGIILAWISISVLLSARVERSGRERGSAHV